MKYVLPKTPFIRINFVTLCAVISTLTVTSAQAVDASDVDLDDDGLIEIETLTELDQIRYNLSGTGYTDASGITNDTGCPINGCNGYELANDLDFDTDGDGVLHDETGFWNLGEGWIPIGNDSAPFSANFEGNGYSIKNLYINRPYENDVGFFGVVKSSVTIKRVHLNGALTSVTGADQVGGLLGRIQLASYADTNTVIIDDCSVTGSIKGEKFVGGLLGRVHSSWDGYVDIGDSYTNTTLEGENYVGGVIGYASVAALGAIGVYNNYAQGLTSGDFYVGGLVGKIYYEGYEGSIIVSDNTADMDIYGDDSVGGAVGSTYGYGYESYMTFEKTQANGKVRALNGNAGGLVGKVSVDNETITNISKVSATGNVDGIYNVGGLIGFTQAVDWVSLAVHDSYAQGDVDGVTQVGGLIGFAYAEGEAAYVSVFRTYASGAVSGSANTGGLIGLSQDGYDPDDPYSSAIGVGSSYWDSNTTGQTLSAGGTGLSTVEMQCPQTAGDSNCATTVYSGWSNSTWDFGSDTAYPTLK
ncbi:hypothetical protein [Gynuella sunshinyii]|uniref:GLUG domain-containing protein n=1 Tax=Gynuella sunshinyii YC6258 TaxID=1445510 RepID=A0A0C5VR21_9GAMM|nr:hypothetical protein [Gynuella sunshinyii]AJQ96691.1 hypothetical Protein YC6258_04659 [Gynuella sunshinyii YC6258]